MKFAVPILFLIATLSVRGYGGELGSIIEREIAPLARQLLEYEWQKMAPERMVPTNVVRRAVECVNQAMAPQFKPPADMVVMVHYRTETTCDALLLKFETNGCSISLMQTEGAMMVVIKAPDTANLGPQNSEALAGRLALRLFNQLEGVKLVKDTMDGEICVGFAASAPDATLNRFKEEGGFFPGHWWSDGQQIGFFGAKHIPKNVASVGTTDLLANQRWFDLGHPLIAPRNRKTP